MKVRVVDYRSFLLMCLTQHEEREEYIVGIYALESPPYIELINLWSGNIIATLPLNVEGEVSAEDDSKIALRYQEISDIQILIDRSTLPEGPTKIDFDRKTRIAYGQLVAAKIMTDAPNLNALVLYKTTALTVNDIKEERAS